MSAEAHACHAVQLILLLLPHITSQSHLSAVILLRSESERVRIERQNPNPKMPMVRYVGGTWRVGGLLALSRAFGDAYLKVGCRTVSTQCFYCCCKSVCVSHGILSDFEGCWVMECSILLLHTLPPGHPPVCATRLC